VSVYGGWGRLGAFSVQAVYPAMVPAPRPRAAAIQRPVLVSRPMPLSFPAARPRYPARKRLLAVDAVSDIPPMRSTSCCVQRGCWVTSWGATRFVGSSQTMIRVFTTVNKTHSSPITSRWPSESRAYAATLSFPGGEGEQSGGGPRQLSGPHFAIRVVERSDDPERSSTSVG